MPIPAIVWGMFELAMTATTAYEVYELLRDTHQDINHFEKNVAKAKEKIREQIEAIKQEINHKIDISREQAWLLKVTDYDKELQTEVTKKVKGRLGQGGLEIRAAIPQKIPFRTVITMVCEFANQMPALQLHKKNGLKVQNLIGRKKEVMRQILRLTAKELADIDLDEFKKPYRLRQLLTGHIFEFMDELLEWRSPLKAEACFGKAPTFADPKLSGTRLIRDGTKIDPFYPLPHKGYGSLAADLAIPDYRSKPLKKNNLFAIIEIKFDTDKIKNQQFEQYKELSDACAEAKTNAVGIANTAGRKGVTRGCRVSLFRYPEDAAVKTRDPKKPINKRKVTVRR